MIVGTSSGVGKSTLVTGVCRIFKNRGYSPAPFKAQNMSLNSFITPEGGEIGRAQATQAEASGLPPHTDMNPVLLKPSGETVSQVILNGKVVGNQSAKDYFRGGALQLLPGVLDSFHRLEQKHNPIVLEGAGGIAELNLMERDIVNLRMARETGAVAYLVGDIERGGIFGSLYGTLALLSPEDRKLIRGLIVNQFRGDISLFEDGRRILEEITGLPVIGVLPHLERLEIDDEDSLDLQKYAERPLRGAFNIAVIKLQRLSNHTDFALLSRIPGVHLFYTDRPDLIKEADFIILPGSKNTMDDLLRLRELGLEPALMEHGKKGKALLGICGGFQMMGQSIEDPDGIEGNLPSMKGLDLIPMKTILQSPKITTRVQFRPAKTGEGSRQSHTGEWPEGYEIHMGRSEFLEDSDPLFHVMRNGTEEPEGYRKGKVMGTYIHGSLDEASVLEFLLDPILESGLKLEPMDPHRLRKERAYDRLAEHLIQHLDMEKIYSDLIQGDPPR